MHTPPPAARGGGACLAQPRALDNELSAESPTPRVYCVTVVPEQRAAPDSRAAASVPACELRGGPASFSVVSAVPASAAETSRCECGFARRSSRCEPEPVEPPARGLWLRRRSLAHIGEEPHGSGAFAVPGASWKYALFA